MSAQLVALFGDGAEPPPDSTEPSRDWVICAPDTEPRSACVICPSFSSSVIRLSRSLTRVATGRLGSLYGGVWANAAAGARQHRITPASAAVVSTARPRREGDGTKSE